MRENARRASCQSNEKQLGLAFIQYSQDYDEGYPHGLNGSQGPGWGGQLYTYIKSTGVYKCPDDPTAPSSTYPAEVPVSYMYNYNINGIILAQFTAPANTVLACENFGGLANLTDPAETTVDGKHSGAGNGVGSAYGATYETGYMGVNGSAPGYQAQPPSPPDFPIMTGLHTGGSNFLMEDGHVKWLHGTSVSPGYNNDAGGADPGYAAACPAGAYCKAAAVGNSSFAVTYSYQ